MKTIEIPPKFYIWIGPTMVECEINENREKAINVKMTEVDPNGSVGKVRGFAWMPKSGLINEREDEYKIARWVKLKIKRVA